MTSARSSQVLWIIMGCLLAWGVFLAIGTIVFPGRLAIYRALIIFSCALAFVAFWGLMLVLRGFTVRRPPEDSIKFPPPGA